MRPQNALATTGVTGLEKPRQESADQRDARMDAAYSFDLRGERSPLAFVSVYADELVREFFEWREREYQTGKTVGEGIFDGFSRWQVGRFGARLFPAADGLLLFRIRIQMQPGEGGRVLPAGYFERTPSKPKALPAGDLAEKAAQGMSMPRGQSKRATEERIRQLEAQASALRAEAEAQAQADAAAVVAAATGEPPKEPAK